MRIWSIHPKYLDPQGLVALWRETLLAQKVLAGRTKGYKNHPQLQRFKEQSEPLKFIGSYLYQVYLEAERRGYDFDQSKILEQFSARSKKSLRVTAGQKKYEFEHLKRKLKARSPELYRQVRGLKEVELHPLFRSCPGPIADWEIT